MSDFTVSPSGVQARTALGIVVVSALSVTLAPLGVQAQSALGIAAAIGASVTLAPLGVQAQSAFGVVTLSPVVPVTPAGVQARTALGLVTIGAASVSVAPLGVQAQSAAGLVNFAQIAVTPGVFLIPPNWATPIELASTWGTDILAGEDGTEQRVSLRDGPAERIKYAALFQTQQDAGLLAKLLAQAPSGRVNLPRWCDASLLTANASIGATSIACDTTDRGFTVGGLALLYRQVTGVSEVRTISAIASGALTTDATTNAWTVGDVLVVPVAPAWLTLPLTRTYVGGVVAEATIEGEWETPLDTTGATTSSVAAVTVVVDVPSYNNGNLAGSYYIAHAEVTDADGNEIPEAVVTWATSDATICTVQAVGLFGQMAIVRRMSTSLTVFATITATSDGVSGTHGGL